MINTITIKGRLGRDPEVTEKQGKNGTFIVAKFSVAVDRAFGDEVDWFNCEVLGNRANVIDKYFSKGTVITLTGNMFSYKTKDEQKRWKIKVLDFDLPDDNDGQILKKCASMTDSDIVDYIRELLKLRQNHEHKASDQKDTFEDIDEDVPF